tara:strand:- start:17753 stop:18880 length:1128 start_codon:yes stop_codon:yes gene_type:complete
MLDLQHLVSQMQLGDRLPPERQLASELKVSRQTLRRAVRVLVEQNVLESRQGSGTYVCAVLDDPLRNQRAAANTSGARATGSLIGLSVPTVEVPAIARVASGAEVACDALGFRLVLTHDRGNPDRQIEQLREMFASEIEGLVVFLDQDNVTRVECLELLEQGIRDGVKVVLLDRYVPGIDYPCVLTDVVAGMHMATQHMLMLGCRRLAVISWGEEAGIAERSRLAGFRNAMKDHGLDPEPVLHGKVGYGQSQEISARQIVGGWLMQYENKLPCDGIICFVDDMAHGAYWALQEAKVCVPQEVALMGFDDVRPILDPATQFGLTTVQQPFEELGKQAIERLVNMFDQANADEPLRHTILKPRLVVRDSCGSHGVRD